jgi:hypothetical protein
MNTSVEKVKFGMGVASMIFIYLVPQMGGFYFFAKLFLA